MSKHRGAPLFRIKRALMEEYKKWCETEGRQYKKEKDEEDMIEFLIQKNFIKGKEFLKFCDSIEIPLIPSLEDSIQELIMMEGYIPPKAWIKK